MIPRPLAFGGALARASARAGTDLAASAVRTVAEANLGIGPARLSPAGLEWARQQVARGLRELLTADVDGGDLLRSGDPTAMARAVLTLLGVEDRLAPLPSPDEQIRHRFRSLLDPDGHDVEGMAPALLTITGQLCPDEARILRHLDTEDRVPVLAVMAGAMTRRTGPVVAEHLTVVTERAGGDHPERGPEYVGNLLRLGLCTIEDEVPPDRPDVDLVTASEPFRDAVRAVREQGARPRVRTGTLRLTTLGRQLVAIALHGVGSGAETARELPGPPPPPPAALPRRGGHTGVDQR